MSVTNGPIHYCPLLLPDEHIALLADWTYATDVLCDTPIGVSHTIHPAGRPFVRALARGTTPQEMYQLAQRNHLTARDAQELLGILNMLGALVSTRTAWQHCQALVVRVRHVLLGVTYAPFTWRRRATTLWILVGILRASWPVAAAAMCVAIFSGLGGLLSLAYCIWLCLGGVTLFWVSLWIHELVHLRYIRRSHATPVILQRGMRLGIVHPTLSSRAEVATALAGPTAGLINCLFVSTICALTQSSVGVALGICVGLFHLGSLLPWYGDGMTLRKAWREAHHA